MKRTLKIPLISALVCGFAGPLVGTAMVMGVMGNPDRMFSSPWDALGVFPKMYLFALVFAGPFGFVIGGLGGGFLLLRARRAGSLRRLRIEVASLGGLLGSSYPLMARWLGWNPFEGLPGLLPISAAVGTLCAWLVTITLRNDLRRFINQQQ